MTNLSRASSVVMAVAALGCRGTGPSSQRSATASAPRVDLDSGTIEGIATGTTAAFLGIPYASPPLGAARWTPPGAVAHWDGVRSAHALGPMCPQRDITERNHRVAAALGEDPSTVPPQAATSEDCLTLNVWTTNLGGAAKQPVLVWIHGGGYAVGTGGSEPASLATLGAVVVTINYRLGLLGFLAHPALTAESSHRASGNYGTLDQIAALRWVQRNIGELGGDRDRVTVVGHSAGGGAVLQLIGSPLARGLLHRGIAQSGTLDMSRPLAAAEADGIAVATTLGVPTSDPLPALRALPVDSLVAALPGGTESTTDGWVLPASGPDALRAGSLDRVPLIIGATADEADIFAGPPPDRDAYIKRVRNSDGALAPQVLALYPPTGDVGATARRYATDRDFVCPTRYTAARRGSPTWLYRFSLRASARMGAFHGSELHLLFATPGGPHTAAAASAADALRRYWVQFARTGDPNQAGLPAWPAYRDPAPRWLDIGEQVRTIDGFDRPGCDVFDRAY